MLPHCFLLYFLFVEAHALGGIDSLSWYRVESLNELPSLGEVAPVLASENIPRAFDWRDVGGRRFATGARSQLVPRPCGSCWAFAATGILSDRVQISSGGVLPDFNIAPQVLLDCYTQAGSCNGGNSLSAFEQIAKSSGGITDESCAPYEGVDYSNWGEDDCSKRLCKTHDRFGNSKWVNGSRILIDSYGSLNMSNFSAIQSEIMQRGPVACYMYAHSKSFEDYTGGVIKDRTPYDGTTHVVSVVGWGDDTDGTPYWTVRNSFGTYWGENGFFRVQRGINAFNMESNLCEWAMPSKESVNRLVAAAGLTRMPASHEVQI